MEIGENEDNLGRGEENCSLLSGWPIVYVDRTLGLEISWVKDFTKCHECGLD